MKIERKIKLIGFPLIIAFLLLYILPLIIAAYYSFIEAPLRPNFVLFANYKRTLGNKYFYLAAVNTLRFMFLSVPIICALALLCAIVFFELNKSKSALLGLFLLPFLIPSASLSAIWQGFSYNISPFFTVMSLYVWKNMGLICIILLSAMRLIPSEIYDSAKLDGAGKTSLHIYITLPMIRDKLAFVITLSAAYSLRVFKEAYLLYGAYPAKEIYLLQHYMNNHFTKLNYQYLASAAVLMSILVSIIVWLWQKNAKKYEGELS